MRERTVLIVDDDHAIAQLFGLLLTDEGYQVLIAHDGAEALEVVRDTTPDAIILDLAMPVMDGPRFYECLREHERADLRGVPVVIVSAIGARRARLELGAEAAMEKPVDLDDLAAEVARLIDGCASGNSVARSAERVGVR